MIVIVDYGMGNLGSIQNMIKKAGFSSIISSNSKEINSATKLVLPGVGSFDKGMTNLEKLDLIDILNKKVNLEKTPILGICLGMQLMTKSSEEGKLKGLGWIDAEAKKFNHENLKVPHMGWNIIEHKKESKLYSELNSEKKYYFVHSYFVETNNKSDILTTTTYGNEFVSAFERNNIIGAQYHPEKSHKFGLDLFKSFLENF